MTHQEQAETERQIKLVVLCIMLGLLLGLAIASFMVLQRHGWEHRETVSTHPPPPT